MFINIKDVGAFTVLCLLSATSHAAGLSTGLQPISSAPPTIRDPFTPSDLMFNSIINNPNGLASSPSTLNGPLPAMRLRGFISQDEDDPIALLEVAGVRTFLVRKGDEISIDPSQPRSVIRITDINRQSITVENRLLGSIRVQR